jgi:hypothetical protein
MASSLDVITNLFYGQSFPLRVASDAEKKAHWRRTVPSFITFRSLLYLHFIFFQLFDSTSASVSPSASMHKWN